MGYQVSSKSQEENSSLESQKEQLTQKGIEQKIFQSKLDRLRMKLKINWSFKN
jgi:hypothetical protein